jgi:hypothetical protein
VTQIVFARQSDPVMCDYSPAVDQDDLREGVDAVGAEGCIPCHDGGRKRALALRKPALRSLGGLFVGSGSGQCNLRCATGSSRQVTVRLWQGVELNQECHKITRIVLLSIASLLLGGYEPWS